MRLARNGRLLLSPGKVPWRKRGSAGSLARTATNRRAEGVDSRSKTSNANAITRVSSNFFRDIVETGYSTNERLGNERQRKRNQLERNGTEGKFETSRGNRDESRLRSQTLHRVDITV